MHKLTKIAIDKICRRRNELGLSYEALANKADISKSHLFYLENQNSPKSIDNPKIETLIKLAEALDIPFYKLFID
ncbi:helix-turn-helix domain-containing protein [Breznakiella homolactica]|uniref:Helix-turn-helix transcriptional regulator n=1 Tax=Breznakiella homolactica TaxID=2798577 RepID=A0A7T7XLM7_9SPIR|nr:helix-turn-helix transcriptional regulator [Breznakiella homolactica]QQO08655.1 helix-turn-helix domain-containing protein [Breznakiella homolactica]